MIPEGADPELVFWVFFLLLVGMPTAAMAGWLLGGVRRRRPPKPPPGLWWLCARCRSVNDPLNEHCYACGLPIPADPETLPTEPDFEIRQRFGGTRHEPPTLAGPRTAAGPSAPTQAEPTAAGPTDEPRAPTPSARPPDAET
jgi:hypothetical protein